MKPGIETFRFDEEFDYECDFFSFDLVILTTGKISSNPGGRPRDLTRKRFFEILSQIWSYQKVVVEIILKSNLKVGKKHARGYDFKTFLL